jgi:hypothetical protein
MRSARAAAVLLLLLLLPCLVSAKASESTLLHGEQLHSGEWISAGNGWLLMQPDGELVVCGKLMPNQTSCNADQRLWAAPGTSGNPGAHAEMQEFGVLSVFAVGSKSPDDRLWQSHTMAKAGCTPTSVACAYVQMQKDGNCVILKGASPATEKGAIWSTDTHLAPIDAKNVLHIIIDDLRPEMNVAYGQKQMKTPAFDRLAREGLTFDNAYCQIAVCGKSAVCTS